MHEPAWAHGSESAHPAGHPISRTLTCDICPSTRAGAARTAGNELQMGARRHGAARRDHWQLEVRGMHAPWGSWQGTASGNAAFTVTIGATLHPRSPVACSPAGTGSQARALTLSTHLHRPGTSWPAPWGCSCQVVTAYAHEPPASMAASSAHSRARQAGVLLVGESRRKPAPWGPGGVALACGSGGRHRRLRRRPFGWGCGAMAKPGTQCGRAAAAATAAWHACRGRRGGSPSRRAACPSQYLQAGGSHLLLVCRPAPLVSTAGHKLCALSTAAAAAATRPGGGG